MVFPVSRKYGQLSSLDLPQSKITITTTDTECFRYLSQTRSDLYGFGEKIRSLNNYQVDHALNTWTHILFPCI